MRAILIHSNTTLNHIGAIKRLSELSTYFSSFDDNRFRQLKGLQNVPCLLITEFSKDIIPRGTTDAKMLFEDLFSARREANRPTIITLSTPCKQFADSANAFGPLMGEIFRKLKIEAVSPSDNIINIRCHAKAIK